MAKREISSTLKNLKFMQRAARREEKTKKEEEEIKPDGNLFFPATIKKCVVIMEGDPHPGAVIGRMSFQSFNPSVDKLSEAAASLRRPEASEAHATSSSGQGGTASFRENDSSMNGATTQKGDTNGEVKRKQSEAASEAQNESKPPRSVQGGQQSSPHSSKSSFKKPKHEKLDFNVLRPKGQNNQPKKIEHK